MERIKKAEEEIRLQKQPELEQSSAREKKWSAQNTSRSRERTMTVSWIYCSLPAATLPPSHRVAPLVPSAPFLPVCRAATLLLASHLCSSVQVHCRTLARRCLNTGRRSGVRESQKRRGNTGELLVVLVSVGDVVGRQHAW